MAYISLKNVSKKIKNNIVLNHVNLEINKGTISGFIGANGSGKTMLFRAILGFIKTDGKILIDQKSVSLNQTLPVNTGTIIETPGFINNYSAIDNLKYLAAIKKIVNEEEIIAAMKVFDLDKKKDLKVKQFSLGMRQKLAIVQAFMENQDLLVLDEPTNGLDKEAVEIFCKKMKELAQKGKTILIASHDRETIYDLADNLYQVSNGKVHRIE